MIGPYFINNNESFLPFCKLYSLFSTSIPVLLLSCLAT
jgi:hypothetical protein